MTQAIERVSPVPYYEQLYMILKERIQSGEIAREERLPSEQELCRSFGLSRATVRQTLAKLESDGYARRIPRRGVFATTPEEPSNWTVQEGFLESQLRHGRTGIETRVVGAQMIAPPQHVLDALRLDLNERVFALERVRSLDGHTAMFSTNWFPRDVGVQVADSSAVLEGAASLNQRLVEIGYVTNGARRVIHAMRAPEIVAAHLQVMADEPVLRVRSLSWDHAGKLFDYYETWVLTNIIPLEVSISAT